MRCAKEKPDAVVITTLLPHISRLLDLSCLTILYPENEAVKKFRSRTAIRLKKSIFNLYFDRMVSFT
jgi:hypothetical protein